MNQSQTRRRALGSLHADDIFLSLVFPAYNERARLPASLAGAISYLRNQDYTWEILVVDDGSTDGTADAARRVMDAEQAPGRILTLERNMGKGAAVRAGLAEARGRIVFFSDADLSTPIAELEKMLPRLEQGFDIVIGSRASSESQIELRQPFYREYAGRLFNLLVQVIVFSGIKDTQCGFKGFRREALPLLLAHQKISGFAFDVELLLLARRFGLRIAETPVRWRNSPDSRVSYFGDSFHMFLDLIRIRWIHRKTKPQPASHP